MPTSTDTAQTAAAADPWETIESGRYEVYSWPRGTQQQVAHYFGDFASEAEAEECAVELRTRGRVGVGVKPIYVYRGTGERSEG